LSLPKKLLLDTFIGRPLPIHLIIVQVNPKPHTSSIPLRGTGLLHPLLRSILNLLGRPKFLSHRYMILELIPKMLSLFMAVMRTLSKGHVVEMFF
jgi:hypothetical protein